MNLFISETFKNFKKQIKTLAHFYTLSSLINVQSILILEFTIGWKSLSKCELPISYCLGSAVFQICLRDMLTFLLKKQFVEYPRGHRIWKLQREKGIRKNTLSYQIEKIYQNSKVKYDN